MGDKEWIDVRTDGGGVYRVCPETGVVQKWYRRAGRYEWRRLTSYGPLYCAVLQLGRIIRARQQSEDYRYEEAAEAQARIEDWRDAYEREPAEVSDD